MERSCFWCDRLPVSVSFISTYICNLVCEHCDICRFREEELSTAEVKAMAVELRELGTAHITFEGGEPLTRADIGELLAHCAGQGMETALSTNGTLVEDNLRELACVGRLSISLFWNDGPAEREPLYQKSLNAAESAKKAGLNVEASIVLTKENVSALPAMIADCSSIGLSVRFRRLPRHGHSSGNSRFSSIRPDNVELEGALRYLSDLKRKGAALIGPLAAAVFTGADECLFEERSFVISPSGDVAPCRGLLGVRKWPNGRSLGFRAAIRKAGEYYCPSEVFTRRGVCNL
jgi:MoaA/NifB/PqqE/SkfB family radical SAM enzyme